MSILFMLFLLLLSQVSVAEDDYCEGYNKNDKLTIAVPGNASFKSFVNIRSRFENPHRKLYSGFCIRVFNRSAELLGCKLPYEFVEFYGTYDELVKQVANKIFGKDHSSLAANVSKAILQLSEEGTLARMEINWLTPNDCSESMEDADSLSLRSLWGIFLFSIGTSSVCFLLCLGHLLRNYLRNHSSDDQNQNNESGPTRNRMQVTRSIARYFRDAELKHRSPTSRGRVVPVEA
ncbi:hypothetical protein C3L33_06179, partial [Rhododendron williamsianum]